MKKQIPIVQKHVNNKKKITNPPFSSRQLNTLNNNQVNNSLLSSITSPSISKKSKDSNRILSPTENHTKNKKKKNIENYRLKTLQTLSPKNKNKTNFFLEQKKDIQKSILGRNKENEVNIQKSHKNLVIGKDNNNNDNNSLANSMQINNSNLNKNIINQKMKMNEINNVKNIIDMPGLKELDQDMMKTYDINKKDEILNNDINLDKAIFDRNEFNYFKEDNDECLTPFQKQEKLIKKLLRTKNYQKFVKKILNNEPIITTPDGKIIEFNRFNKDLYNYEFLDIYYKHNIPFIIMRPRLDVIKRKREERLKKLKENQDTMKEEDKNEETKKDELKTDDLKNETDQDKISESQLTSLLDKSISYLNNNDSNLLKLEKRESLFSSQDISPPMGTFVLTKIPEKTEENTNNRRLNIAFNKATDAARVVRRLEYSYSMRINLLLSKPIFQKKAKVIQNWWKDVTFSKKNIKKVLKLQAYVRGAMIRKAFKEVKHTYLYKIPFLREIDRIISRRKLKIYLDKLTAKYGILKLLNITKPYSDRIGRALQNFKNKKKFFRENHLLFFPKKNKCCYTKEIFDWETKLKLFKAQAAVKFYLMHHNERIIKEQLSNKYNPKLFYMLKYGANKDKLKKKLKNFRQTFLKFKELKLKATLPGNISNKFLFFKYILRKKIFNNLLNYYNNALNNKDPSYQQKTKMKLLLNHLNSKKNKDKLKKYFIKWNIKTNYLKEYRRMLILDRLYVLEAIFRYQKKYKEKVFMLLLQSIQKKKKNINSKLQIIYIIYIIEKMVWNMKIIYLGEFYKSGKKMHLK